MPHLSNSATQTTILSLQASAPPELRIRTTTLIGIGISILIHAGLLLLAVPQHNQNASPQGEKAPAPITLRIAPAPKPAAPTIPLPEKQFDPGPPQQAKLLPRPSARSKQTAPAVPALAPPIVSSPTPATPPIVSLPATKPSNTAAPDMMATIAAARERRRAAETVEAAQVAAATPEKSPPAQASADDVLKSNIKHSVETLSGGRDGNGGVFEITNIGIRDAKYTFRGWTPDAIGSFRRTIEVDAGPRGDIQLAIVRSMIGLIRSRYPGDFSWHSRKLGHVVTMSANVSHNAELEAFLMREFFAE
ncbi:MAG: hypothetical protein V4805_00055 [Pseudomonadota bacterium]